MFPFRLRIGQFANGTQSLHSIDPGAAVLPGLLPPRLPPPFVNRKMSLRLRIVGLKDVPVFSRADVCQKGIRGAFCNQNEANFAQLPADSRLSGLKVDILNLEMDGFAQPTSG